MLSNTHYARIETENFKFWLWCKYYEILTDEIGLILPTFPKEDRHKRDIISSLVSCFISVAYEGISSFLHHKRQKY